MDLRSYTTRQERAAAVEQATGASLDRVRDAFADEESAVHCENLIGAVTIPLGVAGPITLSGEHIQGDHYIPMATTEGALVASVSRGCKAIRESGGAQVFAYKVGVTRGPVFELESLEKQKELYRWLREHEGDLADLAASTSSHLTWKPMMVKGLANYLFVRFRFDTDQAMGMNMATIATQKIVEYVKEKTGAQCLAVAGNFDVDKKPSWLNMIENRGAKAWAEVTVSAPVLDSVLKTNAQGLFDVWLGKCMLGSAMSGSIGFNAHYANVIAAVYAATGQDLAHVVEGSTGITTAKVLPEGALYFSVYLPALMTGTVGGGTGLSTQKEARAITATQDVMEFTELVAGAVLAGELSLLASLAEGSLAGAHGRLGR